MRRKRGEDVPKNWGAWEVHDWGVPPPPLQPDQIDVPDDWDVTYDLSGWGQQERDELSEHLRDEEVEFTWAGFQLTVRADHEAVVDELVGIEAVEESDSEVPGKPTPADHVKGFLGALAEGLLSWPG